VNRWLERAAGWCRRFSDRKIRRLATAELQADEIRTIIGGREQAIWVFVVIEVWSRLWPSTVVGKRNYRNTLGLFQDLSSRMNLEIVPLITTDGFKRSHAAYFAAEAATEEARVPLSPGSGAKLAATADMTSVGLQTSPCTGTGALDSSTPPAQSATDYIYGSRSGAYLVIDQGETIRQTDTSGNVVLGGINYPASRVELRYPYTLPMFSKVIRLLIPSASATGTIYITSSTVI
jgi:hypothetical protein